MTIRVTFTDGATQTYLNVVALEWDHGALTTYHPFTVWALLNVERFETI